MNEGDFPAVCTDARMLIDQFNSGALELSQRQLKIGHRERHVMHPIAARLQKACHTAVSIGRRNQFEEARSGGEGRDTHLLVGQIDLDRLAEAE